MSSRHRTDKYSLRSSGYMNPGVVLVTMGRFCIVCTLLLLVQNITAISISVAPDQIVEGDQVTISISDLADARIFSLQIQGTFAASPGGTFSFDMEDLVLPFSLNDGSFSATLWNTSTNQLIVRKGDTEVKKVGLSTGGVYSTSDSGSLPAGTFDLISLGGSAAPDATSIATSITLQGSKVGPEDSSITFVVNGITDGSVTISILVDQVTALSEDIQVGNPVTPTQTPTTTQTSVATTTQTSGATTTSTPTQTSTTPQPAHEMLLNPGWNFISVPAALAEGHDTADVVFAGVNKEGRSIFTFDGEHGVWTQLLYGDRVDLLDGIWIYSGDSRYVSLSYSQGSIQNTTSKSLYAGWNSIGFAAVQPVPARDALGPVIDRWEQLIGFDSSSQFYENIIVRNGSGNHSDSNPIYPFKGYWIRMTDNGTLTA